MWPEKHRDTGASGNVIFHKLWCMFSWCRPGKDRTAMLKRFQDFGSHTCVYMYIYIMYTQSGVFLHCIILYLYHPCISLYYLPSFSWLTSSFCWWIIIATFCWLISSPLGSHLGHGFGPMWSGCCLTWMASCRPHWFHFLAPELGPRSRVEPPEKGGRSKMKT